MTTQNQKPEQGKRIEITEGDLPPAEVDVRAADLVDHSEPIVLDESDFPTDPERIEVRAEDVGEKTGKIALGPSDFDAPSEGKIGDAEMEAKEKFVAFIEAHLPEEAGDEEGNRDSKYSFEAEGQLIPVETVEFYDSTTIHSEQLDYSMRTKGVYMIGANGSHFEICYDDVNGFGSVVYGRQQEIDPEEALKTIDIIADAEKQGGLTHVEDHSLSG